MIRSNPGIHFGMNRSGIRVLLILVFLVISLDLASGEVPYEQVAENFLKFRNSPKSILSIERIETNRLNPSLPKILAGYLIRLAGGGFILISPARTITPVKAYIPSRVILISYLHPLGSILSMNWRDLPEPQSWGGGYPLKGLKRKKAGTSSSTITLRSPHFLTHRTRIF